MTAAATDKNRSGFTLFELILAIALSVGLLALIGLAINLYLFRVDTSRSNVEESQLARSVLAMIADDLRAAAIYQAQDTSTIAGLVSSAASFDPDSIDDPRGGGTGGPGGTGTAGTAGTAGVAGTAGGASSSSGSGGGGQGQMSAEEMSMPLGVNATLSELYIDVERSPSMEELFRTNTGYTNTALLTTNPAATSGANAGLMRPSTVRTVRYFIRPGQPLEPGSPAVTSLAPAEQLTIGGLVRQEIDRPARVFAEMSGNQAVLESGQTLLAPEVVHIEFRFFDGTQILDYWDMTEKGGLPPAVEVKIWIADRSGEGFTPGSTISPAMLSTQAREYRQIVHVPMALVGSSSGGGGTAGTSGGSGTTGSGMSSGSGGTGGAGGGAAGFGSTQ